MLSRLVSHRSHCLPSRAVIASTKRRLQISRPRRAMRVFSIAASPTRKSTPARRRKSLEVLAFIGMGAAALTSVFLGSGAGVYLFLKTTVDQKVSEVMALGDQFMAQAGYMSVLVVYSALVLVASYLVLSMISWGWAWWKSKRLQQVSMSEFGERLSLAKQNKQEQLDILTREWTVDILFDSYRKEPFEAFSANLKEAGLKQPTIFAIRAEFNKELLVL